MFLPNLAVLKNLTKSIWGLWMRTQNSSAKKRKARSANLENGGEKGLSPAVGSTILVALRVRPFIENEDCRSALRITENQVAVVNGVDEKVFDFSYVFDMNSCLDSVYESAVSQLVAQAVDGYNVCVMAYGQTGSGKTYCMSGNMKEYGVIPHFCMDLFEKASLRGDPDRTFMVSFYELYQEKAYDLLDEDHVPLRVRGGEDVYLQDLTKFQVNNFEELERLRQSAWTKRATESTAMNICSSRSHVFMQLTYSHLESGLEELGDYVNHVTSNVYFVDLAGSERLSDVGYSYLGETVSINSSLSALHRVIFSAGSRLKPSYRDSLLTRLLKDCLGGNARTLLIANVTPSVMQRSETLSTLRFASQAATVQQCAIKNIDPVITALSDLKHENKALKSRIEQLESSQKLVSFNLPDAPSIVEFQADSSLTTWEPLIRQLSFSAFNCDSSVVVFTLHGNKINITSQEDGVFVNGKCLYPSSSLQAEHGDRVVVRGERFLFVYSDPNGVNEFLKCSYHSMKAEYLEKNIERFRSEITEIEKCRRKGESDAIVKSLVQQIEGLKTALSEKENQQESSAMKEKETLQNELENCLALKETFLDLCKREISAFGVKFDSFAELFEAYNLKKDVGTANYMLSHFGKKEVYTFEMLPPETEQDQFGVRFVDYKNKMFGDFNKATFEPILQRLKDYYRTYVSPEDGSEAVGRFLFEFSRRKLQMVRIGGSRLSNFAKAALYNSTVDAAKKRRTNVSDFRLSIGGSKRKSAFASNFAAALGNVAESENTFKTQFLRRLLEMSGLKGLDQNCDFVELMSTSLVELRKQLPDVRAIQRGAISEGIGFFAVLCRLVVLINKISGHIEGVLGFSHPLYIECCLKSISSAWQTFTELFTSWMSMLSDSEIEETFEEVGPLCLEGMSNAASAVVTSLGKLALFVGGKLPDNIELEEIKRDFVKGSKQAVIEITEESEDITLRLHGRKCSSSQIAVKAAELLYEVCTNFSSFDDENTLYNIISPLFSVVQLASSQILDRIECLSAERHFVQKSMVYLRLIADSSEGSVLEGVKEVLHFCEKTIETASSVQLSDASERVSVFKSVIEVKSFVVVLHNLAGEALQRLAMPWSTEHCTDDFIRSIAFFPSAVMPSMCGGES
ncbi:unnamed protein product [Enterobius vermicularis]|uniref:Kinesin motor domain-containing protein n=1 Tax=Enterobius vermicularis TaxID=51028 RepID=A0A0N4UZ83_ENTVE|nr:unnamed protein product [Enterobius vermicularis]